MKILHVLKKLPKKFVVIGLIILIAIGFFAFSRRPKQTLELYTVQKQDIQRIVSASGTLAGKNSIDLKFQVSGKLFSISAKSGDFVSKGQVLASLDNREESITLTQAQNTLRDKQATADKVIDDIHLFQYGMGGFGYVGGVNETMSQKQTRTSAEAAKDNAYNSVKLAQKALEDTLIFAPTPGIITQVNNVAGQNVGTTDVILKMVDTSNIYFDAEVDEADIGKISLGQRAEISLDAFADKILEGTVDEIIPQIKTTSSGATVVIVRTKLDNDEPTFINGLTGQAKVILSVEKNALTIPLEALKDDNTIVIQKNDKLQIRKVTLGIKSDTDVEIKIGLSENEKVVLNP